MSHTITITNPTLAERSGFEVPNFAKGKDDYILVYDREGDLVVWGPEESRESVLRLAKVYE